MSKYRFDGKRLKMGSKVLANVKGNRIYEKTGASKCLVNIRNDRIYEGSGASMCLANIRYEKIYEGSGMSRKLETIDGVRKIINGVGGITLAALWVACIK